MIIPLNSLFQSSVGSESEHQHQLFRHMTEMTILTVQLIVDFSKHLPGFVTLTREDQIVLLKGIVHKNLITITLSLCCLLKWPIRFQSSFNGDLQPFSMALELKGLEWLSFIAFIGRLHKPNVTWHIFNLLFKLVFTSEADVYFNFRPIICVKHKSFDILKTYARTYLIKCVRLFWSHYQIKL